ncbi:hypothetical protein SDJN03_03221, partial [Cucurbita argyrosperma subsp. sororia]
MRCKPTRAERRKRSLSLSSLWLCFSFLTDSKTVQKPGFNFHGILSSSIVHKDSSIRDIYRQYTLNDGSP